MSYRLLVLAGALLLQIHQFYRCVQKRGSKLQLLHKILEMLPLTPSQILQKIRQYGSAQMVAIVKGTVTAGQPITSILNPSKPILYSKLYGAQMRIGPAKKRLLQTKESSFLKVSDTQTNINLYECHKSIIIPTKKISLSQSTNFFQQFKNKFKLMFSRQTHSNFSDLNYSIFGNDNIEQLLLPDPSELSILGKFKKEASQLCCFEPKIISPSKERMVALIQEDLARDQIQKVVLVIFLTATIGFLGKQVWSLYQRYKQRNGVAILNELKKIFIKSRICSICKNNLSCILSKQCMHMTVCQTCWVKQNQICSQCQAKSEQVVQIYVC